MGHRPLKVSLAVAAITVAATWPQPARYPVLEASTPAAAPPPAAPSARMGWVVAPVPRWPGPATTAPAVTTTTTTTGPVPPPASEAVPATATPRSSTPRSFTMAFTGDVLIHQRVWEVAAGHGAASGRAFDFGPLLDGVRPHVADVDWAVCHLEVPLSADGTRLSGYPVFRAPGEVAGDLAAVGFDSCSTASNHSLDAGVDGMIETLGVLEAAGLRATGTAGTPEEVWDGRWYSIGGARVAHLSYTYGLNGAAPPAEAPWMVGRIDPDTILADAARARADGADLVVLSLHWGDEYVHRPNAQQRSLGPALLASPDVDLVIGHHAHVVQPIDRVGGEWLVHGVGNLIHNMVQPVRRDELLVRASVVEDPDGRFRVGGLEVVPLHVDQASLAVLPAGPALRPAGLSASLAAELDASWARTIAVLQQGSGWGELVVRG